MSLRTRALGLSFLVIVAAHCNDDRKSVPDAGAEDRASVELLAVAGNTPTVRLEQDDSSGFEAQTWDIGGNETGFFVRDRTNGATMPLRVETGAPTNALFVSANGNIGIGTATPTHSVDLRGDSGSTEMTVTEASSTGALRTLLSLVNNGGTRLELVNRATGTSWAVGQDELGLFLSLVGTGVRELSIDASGNATIAGSLTISGGCTGCDAVFTPAYRIESIAEHAEYMWKNQHLRGVGPTPEEGPINLSVKTTGILNELEKAHIYIAELNDALERSEGRLAQLEHTVRARDEQLARLARRLQRLESR